jgi:hypothetical protein
MLRAFTPAHLPHRLQEVKVGTPFLVVGFPLGFHDTLHHLPVVMHDDARDPQLPWKLPGVHSARMEMGGQGLPIEESLGLDCAWYADILLTLTAEDALDTVPQGIAP